MQSELSLSAPEGGNYQVGGHPATWQPRSDNPKVIDLAFRGKAFEVTREGPGPNGRPRMFINGIRQPDGKLFQGRSFVELLWKLDQHFDDFVEIPTRLQRIEQKLDTLIAGPRRLARTKLCTSPVAPTWRQERYVPAGALGGFARVPIRTIAASKFMSAPEYRILQAIVFCAQSTGLLTAGKIKLGKLANVAAEHVKEYRESLCNRQIIRPTGRIGKYGVREYELLTHPYLCDVDALPHGGQNAARRGQTEAQRGTLAVPLKTIKTIDKTINKKANRPQAAEVEELLRQLRKYCSAEEMNANGAGWRTWATENPCALRKAIEDLAVRNDNYHLKRVDNAASFINHQYQLHTGKKSLSELVRESLSRSDSGLQQTGRAI